MTQAVVEVGVRLRYDGRVWTLAVLEGARATLVTDEGASAVVLLPYLFSDPSFEVEGGPAPGSVPPFGLLEALPVEVRERALAWQRHVREVETGFPDAVGRGAPREQFDPASRSLAQRERAKAEELGAAAGWEASAATVRRMRARYRSQGLWGLVDGRAVRERSAVGRADERVVAAVRKVLEGQRERSTGTAGAAAPPGGVAARGGVRRRDGAPAADVDVQPASARGGRRAGPFGDGGAAAVACVAAGTSVHADGGTTAG